MIAKRMLLLVVFFGGWIGMTPLCAAEPGGLPAEEEFGQAAALPWRPAFAEPGADDWQSRWHLDGKEATIQPCAGGFDFAAGPQAGKNAHMAVLWTRQSFAGDVRISYDYTRLDEAEHYVTILYIQATGTGLGPHEKDILAWADRRTVPTMSKYFEHMNLLHISYAAMATPQMLARGADDRMYIRARRYPIPAGGRFDDIVLPPDDYDQELWQTGVKHHVDVIKRGPYLMMKVTPEGGEPRIMRWDATGWPPITEGRIGLRHMATRSARYENFTVQSLPDAAPPVAQSWKNMRSVEDVVAAYPERITGMLGALDLTRPGLETVARAHADGDTVGACKALLDYYRTCNSGAWLRNPSAEASPGLLEKADNYLDDIYIGHDGPGRMPRTANGHLAWGYTGPRTDQGFRSRVNRHSHISTLMKAYLATGESKYLDRLDQDIRDWIIAADGRITPWATGPLDPGNRLPHWTRVFYGLQQEAGFTDAARLLMLVAIPAQAEFLLANPGGMNWVTMTQLGAMICGLGWPEFEQAQDWADRSLAALQENAETTVYPDGAQKELTAAYHMVSVSRYQRAIELLQQANRPVPEPLRETTRRMWDYMAAVVRPDGTRPMNNDSGRGVNADELERLAGPYNRPDWLYIASNGERGERPDGPPSRFLPWAGQLISRSGWGSDAHWGFFDVGPVGMRGHRHFDHGHLSITAHGRYILVDSGRFAYSGPLADRFRRTYAMHTRGHNTILFNGGGQIGGPEAATHPHPLASVQERLDFAMGAYAGAFEGQLFGLRHTRANVYVRDVGWLVVDWVEGNGAHCLEPLWHFHPACSVELDGVAVVSTDAGAGNLRIQPVGDTDWRVEVVEGQEKPHPQGWYSRNYGMAEPSPCAVYRTTTEGNALFAWVLTSGRDTPAPAAVAWIEAPAGVARLQVEWPGEAARRFTVVMDENAMPVALDQGRKLFARLLVEEENKAPVVACGWLEKEGEKLAADPLPVEPALQDLAAKLAVRSAVEDTSAPGALFKLPLNNARFEQPLTIKLAPAADNGAGWRLEGFPDKLALATGQSRTLDVRATCPAAAPRYPLPEVDVAFQVAEEEGGRMLTAVKRLALPLIAGKPRVPVESVTAAPAIDGVLEDTPWRRGADVPAFGRMDLVRDPTPRTRAWLAADDTALYVAFVCDEPKMTDLNTNATNRDDAVFRDDSVEILLEPDGDGKGRDYYQVAVSAAGVVFDGKGFDNQVNLPGLKAATARQDGAWTAEIAIPWADLGLDGPPREAGLLLCRNRYAGGKGEIFQFPVSPKGNHQPDHFAHLVFHRQP